VARGDVKTRIPGSIADTVARLEVWAGRAPRGLARVVFHSEHARAEADRLLGEAMRSRSVPYHPIKLPVRHSPSEVVRTLLEGLARLEPGVVSITGFATACADRDRAAFLGALTLNRDNLAGFPLRQVWWLTDDFTDAFLRTVPDLASWFLVRVHLTQEPRHAPTGPRTFEAVPAAVPKLATEEALARASNLVERFQRAREAGAPPSELIQLAGWAARAIVEVGAADKARDLADTLTAVAIGPREGLDVGHPAILRGLISLANLFRDQGRLKEARPILDRALAIASQDKVVDDAVLSHELGSLIGLLRDVNKPREAEALVRRVLASDERRLGPDNPQVAIDLGNLGLLLKDTSRGGEAEPLFRRAVAIVEKHHGPDHPSVALSLNNLAALLHDAGRLAEAEPLYQKARAIGEQSAGPAR
jgi:tetratricopeptide (TPR) repeat protein